MMDKQTQPQTSQCHLIISENHLYDLSIRIAQELLKDKQSFEKIALCLEIDAANDWSQIKNIYKDKKDNSDFLASIRPPDYGNLKTCLSNNGKYTDNEVHQNIFHFLIKRDRILAYSNLCQFVDSNQIAVYGIDTCNNLPIDKAQAAFLRSDFMYTKLLDLHKKGWSTITVVGTKHVIDLKRLNENKKQIPNCHFGIITIPGQIPIRATIDASVITQFGDMLLLSEQTKGLANAEQEVRNYQQGLIIIDTNDPITAKNILIRTIKPMSLKEEIFNTLKLDRNKNEKSELERGLRIIATYAEYNPHFSSLFESSLGVAIDIDAQGPSTGKTALHLAVEKGNKEIITALRNKRARYDIPDKDKKTALQRANGDSEIIGLLLQEEKQTNNSPFLN